MRTRKNGEMTKAIINGIFFAGAVTVAATSPYFVSRLIPKIIGYAKYKLKDKDKNKNQKFNNTFYHLRKKGLIQVENKRGQIYISLTDEGKKRAGKYQIDNLKIKKPKEWDQQWRILIFDIANEDKIKREALRGKIKELGLYQLQKSVWVCPYEFYQEINLLRSFFGLNNKEMKMIVASSIENDREVKTFFNIR